MLKRSRRWLVPAAGVVLAASACTPSGQTAPTATPTPSPSPTYSCTALPSTTRCTPEIAAEQKQQAANFAAAEASYRAFFAERNRLAEAGGTTTATATMKKYASGPYLQDFVGFLAAEKKSNRRVRPGGTIAEVRPLPGEHRTQSPEAELTLEVCEDGRKSAIYDSSGKLLFHGILVAGKIYVREISGSWLIWEADTKQVPRCPS